MSLIKFCTFFFYLNQGITTYKNKKCILCGEFKEEQKDENSFAIKILQDMKDVHKTLYVS